MAVWKLCSHMQSLNSLKLNRVDKTPFVLAALPQSVRSVDIGYAELKDVSVYLNNFASAGRQVLSPLQLRFSRLDFRSCHGPSNAREASHAVASHLMACPLLFLSVERVEKVPTSAVLFEFFDPLPQLAHHLTSVSMGSNSVLDMVFEDTIAPTDLQHLAELTPGLKGRSASSSTGLL